MTEAEYLGEQLRRLRETAGLTQGELASRVGCTWEAISRWERATREPSWTTVVSICRALGVSCEQFRLPPDGGPSTSGSQAPDPTGPSPAPARKGGRPRKQPGQAQASTPGQIPAAAQVEPASDQVEAQGPGPGKATKRRRKGT